jgi:hypothetical protein
MNWKVKSVPNTGLRFASFFSGGFITAIVVNPQEKKLGKWTSVHWTDSKNLLCLLDPACLAYSCLKPWSILLCFFRKYNQHQVGKIYKFLTFN